MEQLLIGFVGLIFGGIIGYAIGKEVGFEEFLIRFEKSKNKLRGK